MKRLVAILALCLPAGAAHALDASGCRAFAWPVAADIRLLGQADRVASGASVDVSAPRAFRVDMRAAAKADFAVAPERPSAPGARAGTLRFLARAGIYQFTMTDRLQLDVAQNGEALPEEARSAAPRCAAARKSVRFTLKDGPALMQFSGSPGRTTAIAITRDPSGRTR